MCLNCFGLLTGSKSQWPLPGRTPLLLVHLLLGGNCIVLFLVGYCHAIPPETGQARNVFPHIVGVPRVQERIPGGVQVIGYN